MDPKKEKEQLDKKLAEWKAKKDDEAKQKAAAAKSHLTASTPEKKGFLTNIFHTPEREVQKKPQIAPASTSTSTAQKNTPEQNEKLKETKKEEKLPSEKKVSAKQGRVADQAFDKHLRGSFSNLKKINEKNKIIEKKKKSLFSIRGFVRALDIPGTLEKAGMEDVEPKAVTRNLMIVNTIIFSIFTVYYLISGFLEQADPLKLLLFIVAIWACFYFLVLGVIWACYLFYLDMKIYKRTTEIERVFPDYLQLASSNISAGMPIDRALWYAVRPNFGILAKEIEMVAKNNFAGQDLSEALQVFARKYDSKIVQRSISLLLEGLAAGGELAGLLNKIALNIEETRILKRDMAANVTTYVIFITFASIVAAPGLLGLSTQLLEVISRVTSKLAAENLSTSSSFFSFSLSTDSSTIDNFRIFSYVMLTISSIFAAAIVNVIQKGKVKDGLSRIPIFIIVSIVIYTFSSLFMGQLFAGIL
jgi:pilus assembly protein TadC